MKDFLIIGPIAVVGNSYFKKYVIDDVIFSGYNRVGEFCDGSKFGNTVWFTSFSVEEKSFLQLKKFDKEKYKKFDKYPAICVDSVEDIPDYDGFMGVPITFIEKYNRKQFKILDLMKSRLKELDTMVEGKYKFNRLLIKKR